VDEDETGYADLPDEFAPLADVGEVMRETLSLMGDLRQATTRLGDALVEAGLPARDWRADDAWLDLLSERLPALSLDDYFTELARFAADMGPELLHGDRGDIGVFATTIAQYHESARTLRVVAQRLRLAGGRQRGDDLPLAEAIASPRVSAPLDRLTNTLRDLDSLSPFIVPLTRREWDDLARPAPPAPAPERPSGQSVAPPAPQRPAPERPSGQVSPAPQPTFAPPQPAPVHPSGNLAPPAPVHPSGNLAPPAPVASPERVVGWSAPAPTSQQQPSGWLAPQPPPQQPAGWLAPSPPPTFTQPSLPVAPVLSAPFAPPAPPMTPMAPMTPHPIVPSTPPTRGASPIGAPPAHVAAQVGNLPEEATRPITPNERRQVAQGVSRLRDFAPTREVEIAPLGGATATVGRSAPTPLPGRPGALVARLPIGMRPPVIWAFRHRLLATVVIIAVLASGLGLTALFAATQPARPSAPGVSRLVFSPARLSLSCSGGAAQFTLSDPALPPIATARVSATPRASAASATPGKAIPTKTPTIITWRAPTIGPLVVAPTHGALAPDERATLTVRVARSPGATRTATTATGTTTGTSRAIQGTLTLTASDGVVNVPYVETC